MRFQYDKGGKWLIEHHADSILKLAGIGPIRSWKALPGEVVQSRQLPDGMVEVLLEGRNDPILCLIEINTYAYSRVPNELFDDIALTFLNRRVVPEVIALTLSDRGNVRIAPEARYTSPLGTSRIEAGWHVVNLWELNAADFLPLTDPGLAPWISLMRIDGPPEPVLQQCKDVIEAKTSGGEQENIRFVTEILAGLRFDKAMLRRLFRKGSPMFESPVLIELLEERDVKTLQGLLLKKIERRYGTVPPDISATLRLVTDPPRLESILDAVYASTSLDNFRTQLTSTAN